ncbi:LPXTG-motif cell wall-anchored protein [Ilumatobacter fluminis]|uniref:LPXTG-motif cell wall-anchored protein n=1 Tax=Ilumatobacter fluminis TaxID=467091 RepID=A0A4R7HW25_9ACTN|nr:LPXTG cell wall anchor domain-containing protein [Ilumatobacter fluminis]TDT15267.1 LPXTG-motif cell wall-anchored protein [Ilumatobacter fluminis]
MRLRSIIAAAGLVAATVTGALAPASSASAGDGWTVLVDVQVYAPDADTVLEGLTLELWDIDGAEPVAVADPQCSTLAASGGGLFAYDLAPTCTAPQTGDYALGVAGLPAGATPTAFCNETSVPNELIPGTDAEFTVDFGVAYVECDLIVVQPAVLIDKEVVDGPSADAPEDFTLEVYDDGGSEVATGTDTSTLSCGQGQPLTNCAVIPLAAGSYQIGETGPDGYVPSNVWCTTFVPDDTILIEAFPTGVGEFTVGDVPEEGAYPFAQCEVTNQYYEGDLVVTKSVTNDDGGLLGPADFTAEIYTEPDGSLVTSAPCMADGSCLDVTLPIGDYRIGEADPQGYTPSVTCTVTREPDGPGPITTNPPATSSSIPNFEAIAGDDAVATVEPFGEVTCEIVNDDPTTTTTTMAPTTTDQDGGANVPTTVAPILPPTGDDNGTMAIIATLLIAIGGALLVARRRIA